MSQKRILAGLLTATAVAAPAAAAAVSTSKLWQNKSKSAICGIKIHAPNKPANTLLCSARGIPRPKNGGPAGDPFVQITKSGRAQLVLISQQSWVAGNKKPTTLSPGSSWIGLGIRCTVAANTATCTNESKHGFTIGNGKYKSF